MPPGAQASPTGGGERAVRSARVERRTAETAVTVALTLDGAGESVVATGVPFFDHMLTALARHSGFDLEVQARGDLAVDPHHTVEDTGIVLGQALREAVGAGHGIVRFASQHVPMDDALVLAAVDVGGRPYLHYGLTVPPQLLGTFPTDLAREFFRAFTTHAAVTLHLVHCHGENAHHVLEAAFKGTGIVLGRATRVRGEAIPSTKGVL